MSGYFPGGRNHISSGLATVDSLGVFPRMGVDIAAMWPVGDTASLAYAYGAIELLRSADGNGLRYADTTVRVEHPEIAESSVYAGSDSPRRVTVLVVNKTNAPRKLGLRTFNAAALSRVDVYRIEATHPSPTLAQSDALTKYNAYAYTAPAMRGDARLPGALRAAAHEASACRAQAMRHPDPLEESRSTVVSRRGEATSRCSRRPRRRRPGQPLMLPHGSGGSSAAMSGTSSRRTNA